MKIIKTKEIVPSDSSALDEKLKAIFEDRTKLHNDTIPPFFAYIQDYAWEAFLNHGKNIYNSLKHEAQGILLGKYFEDKYGEFVIATKYAKGDGNSTHSYVEMTEQRLAEISEQCQSEELLMLVWLHTHPGFGAFYSNTDVNCLKTNFYKKYQLGIVVDILKNEEKGFKTEISNVNEFKEYQIINTKISLNKKLNLIPTSTFNIEKEIENIEIKIKNIEQSQSNTIKEIEKMDKNLTEVENIFQELTKLIDNFNKIIEFSKKINEDTTHKINGSLSVVNQLIDGLKKSILNIAKQNTESKSIHERLLKIEETNKYHTESMNQFAPLSEIFLVIDKRIKFLNILIVFIGFIVLGVFVFEIIECFL